MRSIKVTPDSKLEYHKVRAGFTVDIRNKINTLDRFSQRISRPHRSVLIGMFGQFLTKPGLVLLVDGGFS
jgi:hypothetical protein